MGGGNTTVLGIKNGNFSITEAEVANSLSALWPGDTSHRSMTLVQAYRKSSRAQTNEDDLLPIGLDSHRYRCCGNGVVAPVAEWIGRRIVEAKPNPMGLTKWKLQRPQPGGAKPDDVQRRIDASWAIGQAIQLGFASGEAPPSDERLLERAQYLLTLRDKLMQM